MEWCPPGFPHVQLKHNSKNLQFNPDNKMLNILLSIPIFHVFCIFHIFLRSEGFSDNCHSENSIARRGSHVRARTLVPISARGSTGVHTGVRSDIIIGGSAQDNNTIS